MELTQFLSNRIQSPNVEEINEENTSISPD